ncbi:MAG: amidohydrolase family protein, partial [Nitrososphaerota archaeon]|nr:amidohydrolase family protein [Nitrososphaerota archaeon]
MIVDMHVNPPVHEFLTDPYGDLIDFSSRFFKTKIVPSSAEQMMKDFSNAGVEKLVLHSVETSRLKRGISPSNEQLKALLDKEPSRLAGLCAVDVSNAESAVEELRHAIEDLHCLGLKISPMIQGVRPDDRILEPIYEKCVKLHVPLFVDWGNSAIGIGAPGGGGVKLSMNDPMLIDNVAGEFPDLTIVGCHVAWPWVDEMLAVLMHKANVFCVLSGWYPRMFSNERITYMDKRIPQKFMFGTEYPVLSPSRRIA